MPGTLTDLTRLRITLTAFFALDGFIFAGWVVRIPAIKEQTGASASTLGLALLGVSAGAVITMMLTGRLCHRYGNHQVTVVCAVLLSFSVSLPPLTHSALTLGLVLLVFGAAYGGINVAFNSAAVDLVRAMRRPIMPSFHAAFSLGGMVGAGLGGLVAGALTPTQHLFGLTLIGLLVTALVGRSLLRQKPPAFPDDVPNDSPNDSLQGSPKHSPKDSLKGSSQREPENSPDHAPEDSPHPSPTGSPDQTPRHSHSRNDPPPPRRLNTRTRGLVFTFGLIALCTAFGEGALADWSALHLEQDLDATAGAAAIGYSCFALAMTVGRLSGTRLLERLGRTRTLVSGGTTAAAGMLLGALAPSLWLAVLGFVITGLGLANLFPVAVERAGTLAGPDGVAIASTLGYGGMLLGPPAIGFMADWYSLPAALTSVAVLAAVAAGIGFLTRHVSEG
ncbi:MFS transporter [Streptomyces sp. NBC_01239]|uniref:MFS transporter n=1 Tax=Streptomyces sp. NBC_01239 TaxID=2903792 RepID=UPI0022565918|nr:MFS transporter [Streptomyces sp. NBC_01239]MCX4815426.1 MFS transporter [Streptomyces sp. NBC_01239]